MFVDVIDFNRSRDSVHMRGHRQLFDADELDSDCISFISDNQIDRNIVKTESIVAIGTYQCMQHALAVIAIIGTLTCTWVELQLQYPTKVEYYTTQSTQHCCAGPGQ